MPFTPFNCYSFLLSLTSPQHNVLPLCCWIRPIVCANLQPPVLWSLIAFPFMHTEKFILALLLQHKHALPLPALFYTAKWNKWAFCSTINMLVQHWHMNKREVLIRNTPVSPLTNNTDVSASWQTRWFLFLFVQQQWIYCISFSLCLVPAFEASPSCHCEFVFWWWSHLGTCFCELPVQGRCPGLL